MSSKNRSGHTKSQAELQADMAKYILDQMLQDLDKNLVRNLDEISIMIDKVNNFLPDNNIWLEIISIPIFSKDTEYEIQIRKGF